MNSTTDFPGLAAARNATDSSALNHLVATVNRLVRAERRQALTHYTLAGLFWGMAVACLVALAIRLGPLPVSISKAILSCLFAGMAIGIAVGWVTRRSALSVAVLADIRLDLKQRLSSAWELYEKDPQSNSAAAISHQLLKTRTPVAHRIFPLTAKSGNAEFVHPGIRWGRLLPAVTLLLMLINTLNYEHLTDLRADQIDSAVQAEGKTLRSYGTALARRASADELTSSSEIAESMRQLGRRMEGGTLTRGTALERLSDLRRDIDKTHQQRVPRNSNGGAVGVRDHARARSVIENAAREVTSGAVSPQELRDNTSLTNALLTANINTEAFRRALEEAGNGDPEKLDSLLEELRDGERAARDAEELERAYERVQSSRENLSASPESGSTSASDESRARYTDDDFADEQAGMNEGDRGNGSNVVFRDSRGSGAPSPDDTTQGSAPAVPERDQPTIQVNGKIGTGSEIATQVRVAPEQGDVTTPLRTGIIEQQQQLESVLSKESLPAHQKDYVRRYFLELSRAVNANAVNSPAVDERSE